MTDTAEAARVHHSVYDGPPISEATAATMEAPAETATATASAGQGRRLTKSTTTERRRVPLISALPPKAQKAFLQSRLDNNHLFQQLAASKHGLPAVPPRIVVEDEPEDNPETTHSESTEVEFTRREALARREGALDAREELGLIAEAQRKADQLLEDARQEADRLRTPEPAPVQNDEDDEEEEDEEPSLLDKLKIPAFIVATALGTAGGMAYMFGDEDAPPVNTPTTGIVIDSVEKTTKVLEKHGLNSQRTDLGEAMSRAFELDPEFRTYIMERTEATLKEGATEE